MRNRIPRHIIVADIPTTEEHKFIEVKVYYNMGGANYYTGTTDQRGYWLSVSPIEKKDGFKTFVAFTGIKQFLEVASRFNRKRLGELAATALEHENYEQLLAHVLNKQELELESPAEEKAAV